MVIFNCENKWGLDINNNIEFTPMTTERKLYILGYLFNVQFWMNNRILVISVYSSNQYYINIYVQFWDFFMSKFNTMTRLGLRAGPSENSTWPSFSAGKLAHSDLPRISPMSHLDFCSSIYLILMSLFKC